MLIATTTAEGRCHSASCLLLLLPLHCCAGANVAVLLPKKMPRAYTHGLILIVAVELGPAHHRDSMAHVINGCVAC